MWLCRVPAGEKPIVILSLSLPMWGVAPCESRGCGGLPPRLFFWFFSFPLIPHVRVHDTHTTPLGWVSQRVVCVMHGLWFLFGSFSLLAWWRLFASVAGSVSRGGRVEAMGMIAGCSGLSLSPVGNYPLQAV